MSRTPMKNKAASRASMWIDSALLQGAAKARAEFEAADAKLSDTTLELDVLNSLLVDVAGKRNTLLRSLNEHKGTAGFLNDEAYDSYVAVLRKQKEVEEMIQNLSAEMEIRRGIRASKYRLLSDSTTADKLDDTIHTADMHRFAEKRIQAHESRMGLLGLLSALGVSITYTTIFTASRGRLSLFAIAWACFNTAMCVIPFGSQLMAPTVNDILHSRRTMLWRMGIFEALAAIPSLVGLYVLSVSVVALQGEGAESILPETNDRTIQSGASTMAFLAFVPCLYVLTLVLQWTVVHLSGGFFALSRLARGLYVRVDG